MVEDAVAEDEDVSLTVENFVMTTWLQLLHSELPDAVQQRFCTDLRLRTLASLKPEISSALDAMLSDIRHLDVKAARFQRPQNKRNSGTGSPSSNPRCSICYAKKLPHNHYLSKCKFLLEDDRKFLIKSRAVDVDDDTSGDYRKALMAIIRGNAKK